MYLVDILIGRIEYLQGIQGGEVKIFFGIQFGWMGGWQCFEQERRLQEKKYFVGEDNELFGCVEFDKFRVYVVVRKLEMRFCSLGEEVRGRERVIERDN